MNLEIDFRSGIPIYLQVVDRVKEMIADGRLRLGDQLRTVRALAPELSINFNTVARAYRILDEAGIISTQQGRAPTSWKCPRQRSPRISGKSKCIDWARVLESGQRLEREEMYAAYCYV